LEVIRVKMTNSFGKIHKTYALIGGGAGLLMAVFVAATVGNPLPVLRLLGADVFLPPLWLTGLLWLAGYILLGAAAGCALACPTGGPYRETPLWRGLTFLVVEITFSFAWYRLLFGSFLLLPAWLCLAAGVAAGVVCFLSWISVHPLPAWLCGGVTAWLFCLLLCHVAVILHN
jgi:tryptophan-rich sensory protein